jgi:hypothetical protein
MLTAAGAEGFDRGGRGGFGSRVQPLHELAA